MIILDIYARGTGGRQQRQRCRSWRSGSRCGPIDGGAVGIAVFQNESLIGAALAPSCCLTSNLVCL